MTNLKNSWHVIVVGGGHAGCEAACMSARKGCKTLLVTLKTDTIGVMSCNPAIGGIGKGQLVNEIDAMGGMMGLAADYACIQYRLLNRRKGAAVHGPRGQSDRRLYQAFVQQHLKNQENLEIQEAECVDLIIKNQQCKGIITAENQTLLASSVVLTTGTFLRGVIHQGDKTFSAGRIGENAADRLSSRLINHGLELARLKTGTPARIYKHSIDYSRLQEQAADDQPTYFSMLTNHTHQQQIPCHITHTCTQTHDIIQKNLALSPVYTGKIQSSGPRYCPSIEDKVHRFSDKQSHQIFLEPEGLCSDLVYPNGISTSMACEVQDTFLRTIAGLENVRVHQYGYAIEYDYLNPQGLDIHLQVKNLEGLFLAGQINGSTGYEEAAAQGLIAGLNAANKHLENPFVCIARYDGYIGVMIDDMTSKGVTEPYRMFTSRAEFRLKLRSDNAPMRICPIAIEQQCLPMEAKKQYFLWKEKIDSAYQLLDHCSATPHQLLNAGINANLDGAVRSARQLLGHHHIQFPQLGKLWPECLTIDQNIQEYITNDCRYAHYTERQEKEIAQLTREDNLILPKNIDYQSIETLSHEVRQILSKRQPTTLGQAAKIQGITPSALVHLMTLIQSGKLIQHHSLPSSTFHE